LLRRFFHRAARRPARVVPAVVAVLFAACADESGANVAGGDPDVVDSADVTADMDGNDSDVPSDGSVEVIPTEIEVFVTLDGVPTAEIHLQQGGGEAMWFTDENGRALVTIDPGIPGDLHVVAAHPEARQRATDPVEPGRTVYTIDLIRYVPVDNPEYRFQDPGEPRNSPTTSQCGHCHTSINRDWFDSPHRSSARNPRVQELYAGVVRADDEAACTAHGGVWAPGIEPGTRETVNRCYLGDGALQYANPQCEDGPCDFDATAYGECAGCHAPAIDGELQHRDLLDAQGIAWQYGVSCDVCHRVESVTPFGGPGLNGSLHLLRPSEPGSPSLGADGLLPLSFGPSYDVPNPRMGIVQRDHYRNGQLCSGCHQHDAAPFPVAGEIDTNRWPDGILPIQSTWREWLDGPFGELVSCNSCHMPPNPGAANTQDVQALGGVALGIPGGWLRAPGEVRHHSWLGPRSDDPRMLRQAAAVFIATERQENQLTARVTVRNTGAGHAIPTGEAMRSLILLVQATCDDAPQPAIGGHVVPALGGVIAERALPESLLDFSQAQPGDRIRLLRTDGWVDYRGFGPFGDGVFSGPELGLPNEQFVAELIVWQASQGGGPVQLTRTVDADGTPIAPDAGEIAAIAALIGRADQSLLVARPSAIPDRDRPMQMWGGYPGFMFARVMASEAGELQVPHYRAVDVARDNRLLPQEDFTTTHIFQVNCEQPVVTATLVHRRFPFWLNQQRAWETNDRIMTVVRR
jgi:hypothetical protein